MENTQKKKILVVDDEPYIQRSLRLILELEGYEVFTAADGLEALQKMTDSKPNLILLDLMMPHMDGYEFAKQLKNTPEGKEAYIIALTAKGQAQDETRALALGIDEYIRKPFKTERLMDRIKAVLS